MGRGLFDELPKQGRLPVAENPFRARDGGIPPVFAGRDGVLIAARATIGQLAAGSPAGRRAVEAPRGLGKTALLAAVAREAVARDFIVVRLEGDPGEQATAIASEIMGRTLSDALGPLGRAGRRLRGLQTVKVGPGGVELTWEGPRDAGMLEFMILDAARIAQRRGTGLFVTLDEAHEAEQSLLKPVLRSLHAADQQELPATGWVAGLPGTLNRLIEQGQTYAERVAIERLGLLVETDVALAVERPFREAGVEVDPIAMERVIRESGGYPFFVQAWGEELWTHCRDGRTVTARDAAVAASAVHARSDDFMAARWERLRGQQRDYASAMAGLGGEGPWATREVAAALGRTPKQMSPARAALLASGTAHAPSHGLVGFTVPNYADWVRRNVGGSS